MVARAEVHYAQIMLNKCNPHCENQPSGLLQVRVGGAYFVISSISSCCCCVARADH